jgi:hypothetical protein
MEGTTIGPNGVTFPDGSLQGSASGFPAGTAMLFKQTAAPTGWTKDTTNNNDSALRVVTGSAGSGGATNFTAAFTSRTPTGSLSSTAATNQATTQSGSVNGTTLGTGEMPSHRHWTGAYYMDDFNGNNGYLGVQDGDNYYSALYTDYQGGGGSHSHGLSMNSHNHTQDAHSHTFTGTAMAFDVKYVDVIIATKN